MPITDIGRWGIEETIVNSFGLVDSERPGDIQGKMFNKQSKYESGACEKAGRDTLMWR